jgi:hypothetical protein
LDDDDHQRRHDSRRDEKTDAEIREAFYRSDTCFGGLKREAVRRIEARGGSENGRVLRQIQSPGRARERNLEAD